MAMFANDNVVLDGDIGTFAASMITAGWLYAIVLPQLLLPLGAAEVARPSITIKYDIKGLQNRLEGTGIGPWHEKN